MKIAFSWCTVLFLLLALLLLFFYRGADQVAAEGAKRRSSWLEWAKERLGQEVGIQEELVKETMNKMVDVKSDFATEVVEEAIDGLVGRDGGVAGGGYFGRDKLDAWMEWGKDKLKQVVEEQSEAAKDWFSNSLDSVHDFVKSIVLEISSVDEEGGGREDKESGSNGGGLSKPRRSSFSQEGAMKDEL